MRALVWSGDQTIGTVHLGIYDEGMAVAGGKFQPNEHYDPLKHATELEGEERSGQLGFKPLRVSTASGDQIVEVVVSLVDWAETAGEEHGREVTVFGLSTTADH
mgnify:CR=1 FL=1